MVTIRIRSRVNGVLENIYCKHTKLISSYSSVECILQLRVESFRMFTTTELVYMIPLSQDKMRSAWDHLRGWFKSRKSLLFNNITFYLAWWQAFVLLKAAIPFNFSSPEYLSHHRTRKSRVSPVSRASPAHMNSPLFDVFIKTSHALWFCKTLLFLGVDYTILVNQYTRY